MDTKFCSKCGIEKSLDDFFRKYKNKEIRSSNCKCCKRIYEQSEPRRKQKKLQNLLYEKSGRGKQIRIIYRKSPRGKLNQKRKDHKRRDLAKKTQTTLTIKQEEKLFKDSKGICPDCRCKLTEKNKTIDHIIPLASGSPDAGLTMENSRIICRSCNNKKNDNIRKDLIQSWITPGILN